VQILIACERSGLVRDACRALGHDAYSCDVHAAEDRSRFHIRDDVRRHLTAGWDAMIAFPECTYLCGSGLHWNGRRTERATLTADALAFVRELLSAPIRCIALENPVGCIGTNFHRPSQIIQPYQFGHDASKATCLWLKNLPRLEPTARVPGRIVRWRGQLVERWSNQTDSGQNRLAPGERRSMDRARTYPGIAQAMARQWFSPSARCVVSLLDLI